MNDLSPLSDEYNVEENELGEESEEEYLLNRDGAFAQEEEEVNNLEYEDQTGSVNLDEFYAQVNLEYPDQDYEKAQRTLADYLEHQQELQEEGWSQIYTLNDEIVLLARRRY